jgi:predicted nucleotidyltransferase
MGVLVPIDLEAVIAALRAAGARFAYLHGSVERGTANADSDVDIAAFFGDPVDPTTTAARLPGRVDLLVLDTAPLELAGRVALRGRLLFEDDPPRRVEWEATTRRIYLDERPRLEQARHDFAAARARGRR